MVKGNNTYISDDKNVIPASLAANQNILDKLKVKNLDDTEESNINLDECLLCFILWCILTIKMLNIFNEFA